MQDTRSWCLILELIGKYLDIMLSISQRKVLISIRKNVGWKEDIFLYV